MNIDKGHNFLDSNKNFLPTKSLCCVLIDIDHDDDFPIYRDGADAGDDDDDDDDGGALKSDGFCRKGKGEAW